MLELVSDITPESVKEILSETDFHPYGLLYTVRINKDNIIESYYITTLYDYNPMLSFIKKILKRYKIEFEVKDIKAKETNSPEGEFENIDLFMEEFDNVAKNRSDNISVYRTIPKTFILKMDLKI